MNKIEEWHNRMMALPPRPRFLIGLLLVALGAFGLVAPVIPGLLFGILGLELLGIRIISGQRFRDLIRSLKRL